MPRVLTTVLLGALSAPWLARAGPITFNFTGTVSQVPIDDFATGIQFGDSITGSFTFDSAAVDAIAASTAGSYTSTGPAFGITAAIGPSALLFLAPGSMNIGILNTFVDQYTGHASSATLVLDLFFQDNSGAVFSSDGLPLSPPPLAAFAQREFHLDQTDGAGAETQVDGAITSLTCGSGCAATTVPEPSTAWFLLAGTTLLGGARCANRQKSNRSRQP
jgi:hypothetical protein